MLRSRALLPQHGAPRGARRVAAAASGGAPPPRRANINDRIEQLRRQNDQLKQAIGVFLDQPGDVGAVTGKRSGSWDEGGTASLLESLRRRQAEEVDEEEGEEEQQQDSGEEQDAPAGPVFSTSLPAPSWGDASPATAAAPGATAASAAPTGAAAAADAPTAARAAAAGSAAVPAAPAAPSAAPAAAAPAAAVPAAAAPAAAAPAAAAPAAAAPAAAAPAAAAPAAASPAAAAPAAASPAAAAPAAAAPAAAAPPKPAATIHERVEQLEQEHQLQQQQQPVQQAPVVVKPRAPARQPARAACSPLDLVFVSAEAAPWSKTGGLGDVMGALPQALAERGHRVMVVVPRYTNAGRDAARYKDAEPAAKSVWVELGGGWHELQFAVLHKRGVDYVFVDHLAFQREGTPYGDARGPFPDNLFRFALLCMAALEAPLNLPLRRDSSGALTGQVYGEELLFIANDWHAALLPLLLAARFRPHGVYEHARVALAIHNLSHQGAFDAHRFHDLGLPGEWYGALEWEDPADKHRTKTINVLKAGIVSSDLLVTVSQGYAAEITGTAQQARVDLLLAQRAPSLRGIVNGIDVAEWDPATDKHLAARYSAADLSGKAACKRALQHEMRLPLTPDVPLIGFIGRLDYQKGPDLVLDALPALSSLDCQVVLLGTGAADYEARLRAASHDWGWFCRGHVGFSVSLSHRIIAGCDILLMPSRFEPCGLNQLYAMRYGTVPIAHATGGLTDTIQDYNPFSKGEGEGTGWTFAPAEVQPMVAALSTAIDLYREQPERWRALQLRGMASDCSWDGAAQQWETVLASIRDGAPDDTA